MAPRSKYTVGEKVLCYHGPLLYEAKCIQIETQDKQLKYYIHYNGWNKNWDEWVVESRLLKYTEANINKQKELYAEFVTSKKQKGRASAKRERVAIKKERIIVIRQETHPNIKQEVDPELIPFIRTAPIFNEESVDIKQEFPEIKQEIEEQEEETVQQWKPAGRERNPVVKRERYPTAKKAKDPVVKKVKNPVVKKGRGSVVKKGRGYVVKKTKSPVKKGKNPAVKNRKNPVKKGRSPVVNKEKNPAVRKEKDPVIKKGKDPVVKKRKDPIVKEKDPIVKKGKDPVKKGKGPVKKGKGPAVKKGRGPVIKKEKSPIAKKKKEVIAKRKASPATKQAKPKATQSVSRTSVAKIATKKRIALQKAKARPVIQVQAKILPEIPRIKLQITFPEKLNKWLVDDECLVNSRRKLLHLPARITVNNVIREYKRIRDSMPPNPQLGSIYLTCRYISKYFNVVLGKKLLYKFERMQYSDVLRDYQNLERSDVYGAIHLLRMLSNIGAYINEDSPHLSNKQVSVFQYCIQDFINITERIFHQNLNIYDYEVASPEYIRRTL